jgi:hypothetical protein
MIHVSASHLTAPIPIANPAQCFLDESTDVTVILTIWKRDYLEEQIAALMSQGKRPSQIWIYQCGNFVDVDRYLEKYPEIELIHSSVNFKYFGRFSIAHYAKTKYIWILDDDVIPSSSWIETCLVKCQTENAIISCAGRIIATEGRIPGSTPDAVDGFFFGDVAPNIHHAFCERDTTVDYGCGGWFLQTEWLRFFWQITPFTLENAEDIHLSAACRLKLGVKTMVPMQLDELTTGNTRVEYGRDAFASWTKPKFEETRRQVVDYFVHELGWKPLLWKNDN